MLVSQSGACNSDHDQMTAEDSNSRMQMFEQGQTKKRYSLPGEN
jgi:hypothetical protein